jgi:septal ring factor EnvC (AmiA/AmiB activator)
MRWRRRIGACGLLAALSLLQPAYAQTVIEQLNATKARASKLEKDLGGNARQLAELQKRAASLAATQQKTEMSLSQNEAQLAALDRDVKAGETKLVASEAHTREALAAMLRVRRVPSLALFAQGKNAHDVLRADAALEHAQRHLREQATTLRQTIETLKRNRERLQRTARDATRNRERLANQKAELAAQLAKRRAIQHSLTRETTAARAEVARLSRESRSVSELIGKLERKTPPSPVPIRSFGGKGYLRQPVTGRVLHHFGDRKGSNDTYRGIVFEARPGAVVVAPYDGEVVFTGSFMDYGPMVLLRHKNGYISLLAGMGAIDVARTQSLRAGEPLGRMATAGRPNLYVELRSRAKPIDPRGWFAKVG